MERWVFVVGAEEVGAREGECNCVSANVHGDADETGAQAVKDYGADGERRGHPARNGASTWSGRHYGIALVFIAGLSVW